MTKAVIFDCFGVLTTDGWLAFREKFLENDAELLERGIASNKRIDAGLISYDDFIQEISSLAGTTKNETLEIIGGHTTNEKLYEYIRDALKGDYKIGLLSNAGNNWLDELFEPWQVALFDETVFSYELGAIKPDPVMYETIASRLGVTPEECAYIDDQQRYVEGAVAVGMRAIHFESTAATITQLQELLRA